MNSITKTAGMAGFLCFYLLGNSPSAAVSYQNMPELQELQELNRAMNTGL